jgi:hypothetical protein
MNLFRTESFAVNEKKYVNVDPTAGAYKSYRIIVTLTYNKFPSLNVVQFYSYTKKINPIIETLTNRVTASSSNTGFDAYEAFNSRVLVSNDAWASTTNRYDTTTGNYTSNTFTYINGIGNMGGEWLQIQTSLPLSMNSHSLTSQIGNPNAIPRRYYIVGSNDKLTWYPIQYMSRNSSYNGMFESTSSTYVVDTRTNYIDNKTKVMNNFNHFQTKYHLFNKSLYDICRLSLQ